MDGFNLYYGGVGLVGGHGVAGWRWLDVRALATSVVARDAGWSAAQIARVVYCTARISGLDNPQGQKDQDTYLRALRTAGAVDHIEYGYYVARVVSAPLATKDKAGRPQLVTSGWPVMVKDVNDNSVRDARFMVSVARQVRRNVHVGALLLPT